MADTPLSKAAVDRAGKRLRDEVVPRPEDVAVYEEYRASLGESLAEVVSQVANWDPPQLQPVTTRLKRIESVIDKLRRGNFRLSGINDVAGCRLIVDGLRRQDDAVTAISGMFPGCRISDYRLREHISGYVAVHLNVRSSTGHLVEVQVRTVMQHRWALTSEELSRAPHIGKGVKYGSGPPELRDLLAALSRLAVSVDQREAQLEDAGTEIANLAAAGSLTRPVINQRDRLAASAAATRDEFERVIDATMAFVEEFGDD
jgi:ppGpp synthetase/RelA/SpoT-type nucleotidyltranferase